MKFKGSKKCICSTLLYLMASLFAHASKYSNQRSGSYPFLYDSSEDACLSEEEERIVSAIARVEEGASKPSHRRTKSKYRRPKKKKSTLRTNDVQPQNPYNINADIEKGISEARYPEKDLSINDPVFHLTETRANQSNWSKEPFTTKQMPRSTIASEVSERPKPVPRPLTTMRLQRQANHVSYPPNRTPKASSSTTPWIRNFLSERPKDILLPIPKEYVSDNFNLAQLAPIVERIGFQVLGADAVRIAKQLSGHSYPIYRLALQLILNETEDESLVLQHPLIPPQAIQEAAQALYLMVHARFCQSPRGLDAIRRIVSTGIYGKCPRISCRGSFLLPYGCSNDFTGAQSSSLCQRYCPNCEEIWNCWESKTDGCAFGPSLCFLFLLTHGSEIYSTVKTITKEKRKNLSRSLVMGFRIHPSITWGRPLGKSL